MPFFAFILLLAAIPMLFYWSDSVVTVLPALEPLLGKSHKTPGSAQNGTSVPMPASGPLKWVQVVKPQGFAAFLTTSDDQFRIAAGCRAGHPPMLQLTSPMGWPIPPQVTLNYQYGLLTLLNGVYSAPPLVNAVSMFGTLSISVPQTPGQPLATALATFQTDSAESAKVARALQQHCSTTAE